MGRVEGAAGGDEIADAEMAETSSKTLSCF
jgi:hypothetical protein